MHVPTLLKYLLVSWGVPIVIVLTVRGFTPDPGAERSDFLRQSFIPARITVLEKSGSKGSDHFELEIENTQGEKFFHRDPEREPVTDLHGRIPKGVELRILYSPGLEGNVLMEIAAIRGDSVTLILSFDTIMDEYASRRKFVTIVAGVWCTAANLFAFALWKVDV